MKFLQTQQDVIPISVDFKPFLRTASKKWSYTEYIKSHANFIRDGKTLPFRIAEKIIHYSSDINMYSEEKMQFFSKKIKNGQNLFFLFYENFKDGMTAYSFEEKINMAIMCFCESMWMQKLSSIKQNKLHKQFYNDYTEYAAIRKKDNKQCFPSSVTNNTDLFNISNAQVFKKYSISNKLDCSKIDFFELEKDNVIYTKVDNKIRFVEKRCKSDLIILICYLCKIDIIDLEYGDNLLSEIADFTEEVLGKENKVDNSSISRINTFVTKYKIGDTQNNQEMPANTKGNRVALDVIKKFINKKLNK